MTAAHSLDDPPTRLRVGVLGGGLIAQRVHLPLLRALDDRFAVVALADPSRAVRTRVSRRFAIPHADADHRSTLERDLDAVVVCAPNAWHAEITLDAIDRGLHVLVEKPLCLTVDDADAIVDRSVDRGVVVQVGYMKRHDPSFVAARSAIGSEPVIHVASETVDPDIGLHLRPPGFVVGGDIPAGTHAELQTKTLEQVEAALGRDATRHARSFSDAFLGALVHDVNAVTGLLAAPDIGVLDAFGTADGSVAGGTLALPDGGRWHAVWMRNQRAGEFIQRIVLHTAAAVHELRFPAPYVIGHAATAITERRSGGLWSAACVSGFADPYAEQLLHFHACVTEGAECIAPPAQARADIELLTRMYRHAVDRDQIR